MKRFSALILTLVLIFNFSFISFSYADTISDLKDVEIGSNPAFETTTPSSPTEIDHREITSTQTTSGIIAEIVKILLFPFNLLNVPLQWLVWAAPKIDSCIFNTDPWFKLSFFEANPTGIAGDIQGAISAIYNAFRYLVTAAYIVILVYLAIRMMLASVGRQKAQYKELFKHWLVGLLLLFSFHWVMAFIIWLSNAFVGILANISAELLADTPSRSTLWGAISNQLYFKFAEDSTPLTKFMISRFHGAAYGAQSWTGVLNPILAPIFYVFLIASTFGIIMTYLKRVFTIAVLILCFPLVALSYVFDKIGDRKAQTLSIWLKEFTVNVMIQPIHAVILVFISLLYSSGLNNMTAGTEGNTLFGENLIGAVMSLVALRLIPVGEELLKKLFQINSSMGPGSQGIAGTMAKTGMALHGAKQVAGSLGKMGKSAIGLGRALHQTKDQRATARKAAKEVARQKMLESTGRAKMLQWKKPLDSIKALKNYNSAYKDHGDYKQYLDRLKAETGSKSTKAAIGKTAAQFTAATAGVGYAITSSSSGKFLSSAATNAAIGVEAVNAVGKAWHDGREYFKGDPTKAEDYVRRAEQLSNLSAEEIDKHPEKAKIAKELGIDIDMVFGGNKEKLIRAYKQMGNAAKYGADPKILKEFTPFHQEEKLRQKGRLPDDSGPLALRSHYGSPNFDESTIVQTKNGIFACDSTGQRYKISDNGNANLKDGEEIHIGVDKDGKTITGTSIKDIMEHVDNPEYHELKNRHAAIEHTVNNKVAEQSTLESEKDEAKRIRDNLQKKLDKIDETADPVQHETIKQKLADAQTIYEEKREKYNKVSQELSNSRSEAKSVESKIEKIEESTMKNHLEAEKTLMSMGYDPIFNETAYTAAQDTKKYPDARYEIKDNNANVVLGNGQTYTIKENVGTDLPDISFKPSEFTDQVSLYQNAFAQPKIGLHSTQNELNLAQSQLTSAQSELSDATDILNDLEQREFRGEAISALKKQEAQARVTVAQANFNSAQTRLNTAQAAFNAAQETFTIAQPTSDSIAENLKSYRAFSTAVQDELHQDIASNVPLDEGFSFKVCPPLYAFLDELKDKDYIINLKRENDTLIYNVFNSNGQKVSIPDGGKNFIDIKDTPFECKQLTNTGDSIEIFYKDGAFGVKSWFIKKKS